MITPDFHAVTLDAAHSGGEDVWLEVIRKMDETYADLVGHQVELERKNAALEEAHAFINDVMGAMTDVVIVCDRLGAVTKVNPALERAVGLSSTAVLGLPLADLVDGAAPDLAERLQRKLGRVGRLEDQSMALVTADGAFPLTVNISPLADRRGRAAGLVLVGRPVGELRKAYADLADAHADLKGAQDRLVHAEKMASLGRLVAGVAHEINNPMSFVYGNAHTMKRYGERLIGYVTALHGGDPAAARRARTDLRIDALIADLPSVLDAVMEGAERTRDIVESLRRYSSEQAQSREKVDLIQLIQTSVRWVSKGQPAQLSVQVSAPETLDVEVHSGGIQQVVMNIVQNALDAQADRPEPRLHVDVVVAGGQAVARFRDFGPGIAPADKGKLFDPFFTTKPVGRGTGLGLSISFQIVSGHGGTLAADNHPDGGAVFTLCLPLDAKVAK